MESFLALRAETPGGHLTSFNCLVYKTNKKYNKIVNIYQCVKKLSMIIGCNILELFDWS